MNRIIMQTNHVDAIWTAKLNIELARLLEDKKQQLQAVQTLRFALDKIIEYRDQLYARGVNKDFDVFLPGTLTCNNIKITETVDSMKSAYILWKNNLNRKIRKFHRGKTRKLNLPEVEEEEYEHLEFNNTYLKDDNQDASYFTSLNKNMFIGEVDLIINAL